MKRDRHHNGFTLLELLVVVGVIGVMVALLLPAVQASREAARRMSCSNNFRQIALGVSQYHAAFEILPPHGTGTFNNANDPKTTNQFRLSFLVSISPFMGRTPVWKSISGEYLGDSPGTDLVLNEMGFGMGSTSFEDEDDSPQHRYPAMGPSPSMANYDPWMLEVDTYRCPSDPGIGLPALGRTNYTACLGDAIEGLDQGLWRYEVKDKRWSPSGEEQMRVTGRGAFIPRMVTSYADLTDGLSNTILLGEIATDLGDQDKRTFPSINNGWSAVLNNVRHCSLQLDPERPMFWNSAGTMPQLPTTRSQGRGYRWADAMPLMTGFNTTLPPNHELCFGGDSTTIGSLPPSSRHQGGTHVAMADGAIIFMTDSIEHGWGEGTVTVEGTKQYAPGSQSPFGLWGSLGTRNQEEMIDEVLN